MLDKLTECRIASVSASTIAFSALNAGQSCINTNLTTMVEAIQAGKQRGIQWSDCLNPALMLYEIVCRSNKVVHSYLTGGPAEV